MDSKPLFSVVIPAHDGRERLALTLDSIARANFDLSRIEVVVVDDASTDGTLEAFRDRSYPFRLAIHRVEARNQSAATNEAIRRASGTYVLSSAQDILFHEDLFSRHLACHERFAGEDVAVLGYLPYPETLSVTPFLSYLVQGGFQFAYWMIKDPMNVPPAFLYAPNFSVRKDVIDRVGGFDEEFPYGCQDSDLGIRLSEAGVRIVHDPGAVGYHNHPVEFRDYFARQERVAAGLVLLESKHPDHEGGPAAWDAVVRGYLMYSAVERDRDLDIVARLEPELAGRGTRYRDLWASAFCEGTPVDRFSADDQRTLRLAEALFNAYDRVLRFHWWKGYFGEFLRVHGAEKVRRLVRARVAKGQPPLQLRRAAEARLRRHGIELSLVSPRDARTSLVVHGLESYLDAARWLGRFDATADPPRDHQAVLVVDREAMPDAELEKLREVVDVVARERRDEGVLEALRLCLAETVVVTSAGVEPELPRWRLLADLCFDRMPRVEVLGGSVEDGRGRRRYGYRFDGAVLAEKRNGAASGSSQRGPSVVDVAIPEFLILRRSLAERVLEERAAAPAEPAPWNFELCRAAARGGGQVLELPELRVR